MQWLGCVADELSFLVQAHISTSCLYLPTQHAPRIAHDLATHVIRRPQQTLNSIRRRGALHGVQRLACPIKTARIALDIRQQECCCHCSSCCCLLSSLHSHTASTQNQSHHTATARVWQKHKRLLQQQTHPASWSPPSSWGMPTDGHSTLLENQTSPPAHACTHTEPVAATACNKNASTTQKPSNRTGRSASSLRWCSHTTPTA